MQIFRYEWKKVTRKKLFWAISILLFFLNGVLFFYNQYYTEEYRAFGVFRQEYEKFQKKIEKIQPKEREEVLLEWQNIYSMAGSISANKALRADFTEEDEEIFQMQLEQYQREQPEVYEQAVEIAKQEDFDVWEKYITDYLEQIQYQTEYKDYIANMKKRTKNQLSNPVFKKGSYAYYNLLKSCIDFEKCKNINTEIGEHCGVEAATGFTLTDFFVYGKKIEKKSYTVVGIIEQRYMSESGDIYTRRKYQPEEIMDGQESMECPYAYISMKELKDFDTECKEVLFANVKLGQDYDDVTIRDELLTQCGNEICLDYNASTRSLFADVLSGYKQTDDGSLDVASGYQAAIERINTDTTQKDFYSRVLIPLFALLIAIATFFSLYEAFGRLILSRKKEMGMYRCLGMSKVQMVGMVFTELLFVTIPGIIFGCLFGTLGYIGILWIENHCFGMSILSALNLNPYFAPFIKASTLDPYQYAIGLIGVTLLVSIIIPIWKNVKLSPVEACRKQGKVKKESLKYKIALGINISILLVSITTGYLYFSSQITSENMVLREQAQTCLVDGSDYMMEKNEIYSVKAGDEYRHDAGITKESLAKLEENFNVDTIHAIKIAHGTHFVYDKKMQSEEVANYLEPNILICEWLDDNLEDPYNKAVFQRFDMDRKQKGYKASERVYQIPTTAMSEEELKSFSEYLIQGEIDFDAINKGKEIVLVSQNDTPLPYKVGDQVTMNVNLYPEEQDASSDYFSTGNVEGMEPNFTDYIGDWYSIGKRKDWTVKVGAILYLTDYEKANFYLSGNGTGLNVFTTIDGLASWETLDANYTKVAVKLKQNADYSDFETCWYQMLQRGKLMTTKSLDGIRNQIRANFSSSMAIFIAMAGMMILISIVGILNAVSMQVLQEKKRTSMMRAIGASKSQMRRSMQKRWIGMVLCGGLLAEAVTVVILCLQKYVEQKVNSYLEGSLELELTWWGFNFPFNHIEKIDCVLAAVVTLIMLLLMVLVAGGVYQYTTGKESIAEAMREE